MNHRTARFTLVLVVLLVSGSMSLTGCGGSMASPGTPNATPAIASISPSMVPAGSGPFNLLISGEGLSTTTVVHFGGNTFNPLSALSSCVSVSNCQTIGVTIPAADVTTAGPVNVTVSNASINSNSMVFTVSQPQSAANTPDILAFFPTIAPAGGASFKMVIIGVNVAANAVVNFGGQQLSPTSVLSCSPGGICPELVQVPASAIAAPGQVSISLTNPGANGGTSSAASFEVLSKATFPVEESVNNSSPAVPANGNSTHSSAAAGGAFVAFDSTATNLVAGVTSGLSQVYLRTNCFAGQPTCVSQTTLVSAAADGTAGSGGTQGSDKPVISLDGRFVAFESDDTNLAPGVTQAMEQIYLRDTCNSILGPVPGCTPSTTLISASPSGAAGNAPSLNPTISALGFFVAFQSTASNLTGTTVPPGVSEVYLSRQCPPIPVIGQIPGCSPSVTVASLDSTGNSGDKDSVNPSLDAIGLALSFESKADNIAQGKPGNGFEQIYARNTCFALSFPGITIPCPNVAIAVSIDVNGNLGTADSVTPATGLLATAVAYATRAPNLLPPNTANQQIVGATTCVLENTLGLACSTAPAVVSSVDQNGVPGRGDSSNPATDGLKVGFTSVASLLPNVSGQQVYVANPCLVSRSSCTPSMVLASADSSGKPLGGDFAAIEGAGIFATFSTKGSTSSGTSEVFLAGPFF